MPKATSIIRERKSRICLVVLAALSFAVLFSIPSVSARATIEVVESAPIQTDLMVPGVRKTPDVWIEMIEKAKTSIDLEQFYVYNKEGSLLDPVLLALKSAAKRGVKVRFLLDKKFYSNYHKDAEDLNSTVNVRVHTIDFSASGGIQHAKFFIVDNRDCFSGSANFDWVALSHVHEVGLRVRDSAIAERFEAVFNTDWSASAPLSKDSRDDEKTEFKPETFVNAAARGLFVVVSPVEPPVNGIPDTIGQITRLIEGAKKSCKIQVYDYATKESTSSKHWDILDSSIREAANSGVAVQLLVDHKAMKDGKKDLQALSELPNVKVKVVTIPEWSGGHIPFSRLVHSKYMIVDDSRAWVGSENWRGDYFKNSRNVGLVLNSKKTIATLNNIFDRLWNSSYSK